MSGADTRVIGGGFRHIRWRCEREVPDCVRGWERDENRGDEENVANGESSSMRGDSTRGYGYWPPSTVGNRPSSWMAAIKAPSHDDMCTDSRGVD